MKQAISRFMRYHLGKLASLIAGRELDPQSVCERTPKLATADDVKYFKDMYPTSFNYMAGKQSGDLLIIAMADPGNPKRVLWACRCKCGRYTVRKTSNLKRKANPADIPRSCTYCSDLIRLKRALTPTKKTKVYLFGAASVAAVSVFILSQLLGA